MNINDSLEKECTGCGLCEAVCPVRAIRLKQDAQGFLYPEVDEAKCVDCELCVKYCTKYKDVPCSELNAHEVFAMWSKSIEVQKRSSSGGIGYELSRFGYSSGYEVWGVIYDSERKMARHVKAKSENDLILFQSSKYLQSDTSELMNALVNDSKHVRKMIFGTPCQIRAIREYISSKDMDGIILIDVFCRGVPTYLLWESYLRQMGRERKISANCDVNFRDKQYDWHICQMTLRDSKQTYSSPSNEDMFYRLYTSALCFRDSCYNCDLKLNNSYADIRIGDFWGERFHSRKDGVSLVIVNSKKGKNIFKALSTSTNIESASFDEVIEAQKYIYNKKSKKIYYMRKMLTEEKTLDIIYRKLVQVPVYKIVTIRIYQILPRCFQLKIKKLLVRIKGYG